MKRFRAAVAAFAALSLMLAACGDDEPDDNGQATEGEAEGEGEGEGEAGPPEGVVEFVSIATGGTGGAYYPIGGAAGAMLAEQIEGVESGVAETTGGSVENINLLHDGRTTIAMAQGDAVYTAANGEGEFDQVMDIRTIGMPYLNVLQIYTTRDRGIESFSDLAGQRVSVGDTGSGTEVFMRTVTETLGMSYDDFGEAQRLGFDDQTAAIRNNQLDAGTAVVAPGGSAIADLASSDELWIVPFTDEEVDTVAGEFPYYTGTTIEGGTYSGLDEDVQTLGTYNSFLMHPDASREFVYAVTKALHENVDALASGHPAAEALAPENISEAVAPLHPGAIDYLLEVGVEIPEELYPEEWEE
ncbi:MAG: TAXI family TRAP transporter solute-binding subunit [Ilumatobacteraceae bacterium]